MPLPRSGSITSRGRPMLARSSSLPRAKKNSVTQIFQKTSGIIKKKTSGMFKKKTPGLFSSGGIFSSGGASHGYFDRLKRGVSDFFKDLVFEHPGTGRAKPSAEVKRRVSLVLEGEGSFNTRMASARIGVGAVRGSMESAARRRNAGATTGTASAFRPRPPPVGPPLWPPGGGGAAQPADR